MRRWLLVLTLSVVSAHAHAQAGQPMKSTAATAMKPTAATENAAVAANAAERQVAQLATQKAALEKRYNDEVDAIDRLKKQRPSWRRDREIRDSLSSSLETSNKLDATTAELKNAKVRLDNARRAYLGAVELELGAGVTPLRAQQLERIRSSLATQVKGAPRNLHILMPELEIDPLADPEELDQRAVELRETENQLTRQIAGLEGQIGELERAALLRKHNDRAAEMVARDEESPHRRTTRSGESTSDAPPDNPPGSRLPVTDTVPTSIKTGGSVVTSRVIDGTPDSLGQRSSDPVQRAEAAHKAYDGLVKRLEQVKRARLAAEARADQLRGKR